MTSADVAVGILLVGAVWRSFMREPGLGLCSLLNLNNPTEFLEKFWPEQLYIAQGAAERLAGLVDYDLEG